MAPTRAGIAAAATADPEFPIAARFWNATLRLDVGDRAHVLQVANGAITREQALPASDPAAATYTVRVAAPESEWTRLLVPVPRPYYQDLFGAMSRHDFKVDGDVEAFFAYYPAVRRLVELARTLQPAGATA